MSLPTPMRFPVHVGITTYVYWFALCLMGLTDAMYVAKKDTQVINALFPLESPSHWGAWSALFLKEVQPVSLPSQYCRAGALTSLYLYQFYWDRDNTASNLKQLSRHLM